MFSAENTGSQRYSSQTRIMAKQAAGYYADVYDGRVWNRLSITPEENTCVHDQCRLVPTCTDSIYLVIVNLPRRERYKRENVSLIPSLHTEPSSFLSPNDLKELWEGVRFYTSESPRYKVLVRGALICAACDIPAVVSDIMLIGGV